MAVVINDQRDHAKLFSDLEQCFIGSQWELVYKRIELNAGLRQVGLFKPDKREAIIHLAKAAKRIQENPLEGFDDLLSPIINLINNLQKNMHEKNKGSEVSKKLLNFLVSHAGFFDQEKLMMAIDNLKYYEMKNTIKYMIEQQFPVDNEAEMGTFATVFFMKERR